MPGWEMKHIEAEADRLLARAAEDDELRANLRSLAHAILEAAEGPPAPPTPERGVDPVRRSPPREPLHELTLGQARPTPVGPPAAAGTTADGDGPDDDLDAIEERCTIQAKAARLASARLRRPRGGEDPGADGSPDDTAWRSGPIAIRTAFSG